MNRSDLIEVKFTIDDLEDAKAWAKFLNEKNQGRRTVSLSNVKNITGFLGHTAVERVMFNYGLEYYSTKVERFAGGDQFDIKYGEKLIDVKSNRYDFPEKYFYNVDMTVWNWTDFKIITHLVFVLVSNDLSTATIFGATSVDDFKKNCKPSIITKNGKAYNYAAVKSRELAPFRNFCYSV